MHNKTTPNAAAAALTTLMHALIDIECTAELAQGELNSACPSDVDDISSDVEVDTEIVRREKNRKTGHSSPWNVSDTSQRGR